MIIVTGASRGLGRAVAESLVEAGREVLGISRETEGLPFEALACGVSDYGAQNDCPEFTKREDRGRRVSQCGRNRLDEFGRDHPTQHDAEIDPNQLGGDNSMLSIICTVNDS